MFVDLHMHCQEGSDDSIVTIPEIVEQAKAIGLDAICITDHDTLKAKATAKAYSRSLGFPIFVGVEILTHEGDITVFGLDEIPENKMHAQELVDFVNLRGGAAIAVHPFRDNNRGLEQHLYSVKGLAAIETYNGNTKDHHNEMAEFAATTLGLPHVGGSDCHKRERVGVCCTKFEMPIHSESDLILALKSGLVRPAKLISKQLNAIETSISRLNKVV